MRFCRKVTSEQNQLYSYLCFESESILEGIFIVQRYSGVIGIFHFVIFLVTETCGCIDAHSNVTTKDLAIHEEGTP